MNKVLHMLLAAPVLIATSSSQAASVSVGITAQAIDGPDGFGSVSKTVGGSSTSPPAIIASTFVQSGVSLSSATVQADGRTGEVHADFKAMVATDDKQPPPPGRDASVLANIFMGGSIKMSDGLPPGVATFGAVLEGAFILGNSSFAYANQIHGTYVFSVGDGGVSNTFGFDTFFNGHAGTFSIPLSVKQLVHGGEVLNINLDLFDVTILSVAGAIELDALDTFKLTNIDLPPGYTYTSDADGFLSKFAGASPTSPIPEPETYALLLAGLVSGGCMLRRCRAMPSMPVKRPATRAPRPPTA